LGDWLANLISGIPVALQVIILAAVPVTELRFSIPAAMAMGVPPTKAYGLSVVGNIMPVCLLLVVWEPVFRLLSSFYFFEPVLEALLERTRKKGDKVQKYGALGLMLFVAIPAPGTGVWTGSLLAYLLGIQFKYAFLALSGGVLIAGALVTLATVGVLEIISRGYGLTLAVLGAVVFIYLFLIRRRD